MTRSLVRRMSETLIALAVTLVVITLLMRLLGKDYMARRLDRNAASYRIPSAATPPKRLEKPF